MILGTLLSSRIVKSSFSLALYHFSYYIQKYLQRFSLKYCNKEIKEMLIFFMIDSCKILIIEFFNCFVLIMFCFFRNLFYLYIFREGVLGILICFYLNKCLTPWLNEIFVWYRNYNYCALVSTEPFFNRYINKYAHNI